MWSHMYGSQYVEQASRVSYQGFSHTEREGWVCLGIPVVKGDQKRCRGLCTLCTQSLILLKAGAKGDWLRVRGFMPTLC